ncbi:MAG TPA: hypothetical protein VNC50_11415, partial [Planctomycetia bacterium]|nr:hypothetical protein [Planctomycetia bacterium]
HKSLAADLGGADAESAGLLAASYEHARYVPPDDPLPADAAKRLAGALAKVKALPRRLRNA